MGKAAGMVYGAPSSGKRAKGTVGVALGVMACCCFALLFLNRQGAWEGRTGSGDGWICDSENPLDVGAFAKETEYVTTLCDRHPGAVYSCSFECAGQAENPALRGVGRTCRCDGCFRGGRCMLWSFLGAGEPAKECQPPPLTDTPALTLFPTPAAPTSIQNGSSSAGSATVGSPDVLPVGDSVGIPIMAETEEEEKEEKEEKPWPTPWEQVELDGRFSAGATLWPSPYEEELWLYQMQCYRRGQCGADAKRAMWSFATKTGLWTKQPPPPPLPAAGSDLLLHGGGGAGAGNMNSAPWEPGSRNSKPLSWMDPGFMEQEDGDSAHSDGGGGRGAFLFLFGGGTGCVQNSCPPATITTGITIGTTLVEGEDASCSPSRLWFGCCWVVRM